MAGTCAIGLYVEEHVNALLLAAAQGTFGSTATVRWYRYQQDWSLQVRGRSGYSGGRMGLVAASLGNTRSGLSRLPRALIGPFHAQAPAG